MIVKSTLTLVLLTYLAQAKGQTVFNTTNGPVRGETINVNGKSLDVLLSIPFAKPPVGNLRFKPPQPADAWTGVLEATKAVTPCVQHSLIVGTIPPQDPRNYSGTFSEDCLYLNIWKPSSATFGSKLPVMVWIYGGGFNLGTKDTPLNNGQYLSSYDVIVVSMNYRVGLLGFGYLGPDTLPGNLGLLDQLEAMKWVRNNIDNFGGDPEKVTLFGESAGSWSVGLHLFSPLSSNFYRNVILQSGAPIDKLIEIVVYSKERARDNAKALAELLQCPLYSDFDVYSCLMGANTDDIITASNAATMRGVDFYPVVDGSFLKEKPLDLLNRGDYKKSNVLMGVTKDEFTSFLMTYMNPNNLQTYETMEELSYEYVSRLLSLSLRTTNNETIQALRVFYESKLPNPRRIENILQTVTEIGTDVMFTCPALKLGSAVSTVKDVFFYILNYRVSSLLLPSWTGVPHSYDMDLMFGHPLNTNKGYTDEDREVSRTMMTYWTNFVKSGNPNSPLAVKINWPTFDSRNQNYMALDSGSNLATRQGPRRHECAFVNEILPNITSKETTKPPSCVWPVNNGRRNVPQDCSFLVAMLLSVLALL